MDTILVTGGAGYIGCHCARMLEKSGFLPVTYDNLVTGHKELVRFGPLVEGDVRDRAKLIEVMTEYKPVAVLHLAALSVVGESVERPGLYDAVNVGGTQSLLAAMGQTKVRNLVFSSTASVYGDVPAEPITEALPAQPVNPYGATKLACERMIAAAAESSKISAVTFRYFNAAGANADAGIGEWHEPETHLIPLVLDVAAGRRPAIDVLGTDYPTPDGTAIRDYIHVADIARAHLLGLTHLLGDGSSLTLNLGTGTGASVLEVLDTVEAVTGRTIARNTAARRPGDSPILVADAARAEAELGWTPRQSDLKTIVEDAWAWHQTLA